jgi:hypothetical protein
LLPADPVGLHGSKGCFRVITRSGKRNTLIICI